VPCFKHNAASIRLTNVLEASLAMLIILVSWCRALC
jgi:hypothetical protein